MNYADKYNKEKEAFPSSGGGWFKMKEGDNKMRVLVDPEVFFEDFKRGICYTECGFEGTPKYLTFILDHADGKLKLAKLPMKVMDQIISYMTNEDYAFQKFPSPYDITINAINAGTKEVKYTVIPARNNSAIEPNILEELSKKGAIVEIIEKLKKKNEDKDKASGIYENNAMRAERMRKELAENKMTTEEDVDTVECPEEEINPEDIPF